MNKRKEYGGLKETYFIVRAIVGDKPTVYNDAGPRRIGVLLIPYVRVCWRLVMPPDQRVQEERDAQCK